MSNLATFKKNVDADYYKQAVAFKSDDGDKLPPLIYFAENMKQEYGVYPEQHQLKEHVDYWMGELNVQPWENRRREKVKQFAERSWIMETVFQDCGVTCRGEQASTIEKAFSTSATQALFPLFFDNFIISGILANDVLSEIVSTATDVPSHTADHLTFENTAGDRSMQVTGEGATFVELTIITDHRQVKLRKFGMVLKTTYEALRLARLPVLALALQEIAQQYANDITDLAIETLIAGDGAGDGSSETVAAVSAGSPLYSDLVNLELDFPMNFKPDTIIYPKEVLQKLLAMPVFLDPQAGVLHQTRGTLPRPLGMNPVRWDVTGKATSYTDDMIIMMQKSRALIQYTEGGLIQESDKIINGQWNENTASTWTGFGRLQHDAVRVGTDFTS